MPRHPELTVAIDGHHLEVPYSGNARYTNALITGLRRHGRELGISARVYEPQKHRRGRRLLWELPSFCRRGAADILHCQYLAPPIGVPPVCLAIHDAAFALPGLPEYSPVKTMAFSLSARVAKVVVTLSQASALDLERYLRVRAEKVSVVPAGVELAAVTDEDRARVDALLAKFRPPYVLYVGRMARRKGLSLLADAFDRMTGSDHGTLLLVGPGADDTAIEGRVSGRSDIARIGPVDERLKCALLTACDAFAYLSAYEGFGLPVVEAMLSGIPTVALDIPVMREISGEWITLVRPDPGEVAAALTDAVRQRNDSQLMGARKFADRYSLRSSTQVLCGVLHGMLQ